MGWLLTGHLAVHLIDGQRRWWLGCIARRAYALAWWSFSIAPMGAVSACAIIASPGAVRIVPVIAMALVSGWPPIFLLVFLVRFPTGYTSSLSLPLGGTNSA